MDAPTNEPTPLRPRTVGELLNAAFQIYARHWQNLALLVAIVVVPLTFAQVLVSDRLIRNGWTTEAVRNGRVEITTPLAASLVASAVVALVAVVIWTTLTGAITLAAAGTMLGRDLDIGASYRFGLSRFWSLLWIGILIALSLVAGFILLIVPGFIVLTRLTCVVPALVVEGKRGGAALRRSWDLVKGRGWPVFGTIIVAGIISGMVSALFTSPFGNGWVVRALASSLAQVITMPFTALVGILIYLDLRIRTEGLDEAGLERDLSTASA